MRRIAITILVLAYTVGLKAQELTPTAKGNFMIGGSAGFSHSKNNLSCSKNFDFAPNIGYFIIDGLAVGATPMYSYSNIKPYNNNSFSLKTISHTFSIAPFVRYIFKNGIFTQIEGGIGKTFIKRGVFHSNEDSKSTTTTKYIQPSIGYSYFINSKVAIEASAYYKYTTQKEKEKDGGTNLLGSFDKKSIGVRVGIQAYL